MNKFFTKLGMIVAFVLSFLSASAYHIEVDGIYYSVSDFPLGCSVVSGDAEYEGEVIIPSTVTFNSETIPVVGISERAFRGCRSLMSVTIPDSVTRIGKEAFSNCISLMSITIGNSVKSIGEEAFIGCRSLTSVTIPDLVTSISKEAFSGCSSLTSVTIPDSVTSIGEDAFSRCSSLTSVTIPNSVTSIGKSAFKYCSSLTSVKLSENLERINYGTFYNCSKLESIEIPGSVKEIVQCELHKNDNIINKFYLTFENLKKLSLKYSEEYLSSSYYDYKDKRVYSSEWDYWITVTLEEVFFDRQMQYSMPLPNVKILSFGEHLKKVQVQNIQNCEKLDTIVCYGTEPPTLPECSNKQYMNVVVKVPQEVLEKYQQAENWKNFWNLQGFDPGQSSVDEIPVSSVEKVETGRYNLNGQRVGEDYKGIVIVRYSDGSTRKLIAK